MLAREIIRSSPARGVAVEGAPPDVTDTRAPSLFPERSCEETTTPALKSILSQPDTRIKDKYNFIINVKAKGPSFRTELTERHYICSDLINEFLEVPKPVNFAQTQSDLVSDNYSENMDQCDDPEQFNNNIRVNNLESMTVNANNNDDCHYINHSININSDDNVISNNYRVPDSSFGYTQKNDQGNKILH